jgi:hypothetical protein
MTTLRRYLLWVGMLSFLGIIILAVRLLTDQSLETEVRLDETSQFTPKQLDQSPNLDPASIVPVVPLLNPAPTGSSLASSDIARDEDLCKGTVSAWGSLSSNYGDVVANESIRLMSESANQRYSEISDENGHISFEDIVPATDYRLSVSPTGMYKRVSMDTLEILTNQTTLAIVLEPLELGTLKGKVVNTEGIVVPGYELRIQSPLKSRWVRNIVPDAIGEFKIENVPVGPVVFTKTFDQALRIAGHDFSGESHAFIELVVDVGNNELRGVVYGEFGNAIPGATVVLDWRHSYQRVTSTVTRRSTTRPSGEFLFQGLGKGEHELLVTTFDGLVDHQMVEIGSDYPVMVVNLKRLNQD